jgi:putative ABC transport system permease protein
MASLRGKVARAGRLPVVGLALRDLLDEWVMSLCIILALTAVMTPLLLLLGLKEGVVGGLRERLESEPSARELRPTQTLALNEQGFKDIVYRDDVAWAVPSILAGSSAGRISPKSGEPMAIDLVPSQGGDPVLANQRIVAPGDGQVVLTEEAAKSSGLTAGSETTLTVSRRLDGRFETQAIKLKVTGVLPAAADVLARAYLPYTLLRDIEAYREGRAVESMGWPGKQPYPPLLIDGVAIVAFSPINEVTQQRLSVGTGFSQVAAITAEAFKAMFGFEPPQGSSLLQLSTATGGAPWRAIGQVRERLTANDVVILPFVSKIELTIAGEGQPPVALSLSEDEATRLALPTLPWPSGAALDTADVAPAVMTKAATNSPELKARLGGPSGDLSLKLTAKGESPLAARSVIPIQLASALRAGREMKLVFDADKQRLLQSETMYRGMRLYARSIDDVETLGDALRAKGVPTMTRAREIARVRTLTDGLTRIFLLVAAVAITGAAAALITNMLSGVERKKSALAVLRLLGAPRLAVSAFPIAQGTMLAAAAGALSFGAYSAIAVAINSSLASEVGPQTTLVELGTTNLVLLGGALIAGSILSSSVASARAYSFQIAEALRVE